MSKKRRFFNQNCMTRVQVNDKVYTVTRMLPSSLLITDPEYQRPLEMPRVKRIVDKFDPGLVNILKVSHRNGKYYVFDGGHTLAALKIIHEGEASFLVECKVYENLTFEEEARLFAAQTGESRDVDFMYRLRALAVGKDPETLEFIQHTENAGFKLALGSSTEGSILALKKAKKIYDNYGADVYEDTLRLIRDTWEGEQQYLQANILGGVAVFLASFGKEYLPSRFVRKLRTTKAEEIRVEAKHRKNAHQSLDGAFAQEIANTYNRGGGKGRINPMKILAMGFEDYE